MIFRIFYTSGKEGQPHPDAYSGYYTVCEYIYDTEKKFTVHEIEKSGWLVTINTLNELMCIIESFGKNNLEIIISQDEDSKLPTLEIYDHYRE